MNEVERIRSNLNEWRDSLSSDEQDWYHWVNDLDVEWLLEQVTTLRKENLELYRQIIQSAMPIINAPLDAFSVALKAAREQIERQK